MTPVIYTISFAALVISIIKSREKTIAALLKAWHSFQNILPQFLAIIMLIGIALSILTPEQISIFIGSESGWAGVMIASFVGSITLIPAFVAFPLAAALLQSGAGYMQLAGFVSTSTAVGIVTMSLEMKYFGKKTTLLRNGLAFLFSLVVAIVMGVLMQ